jgi:SAM-dependent methyltransferase
MNDIAPTVTSSTEPIALVLPLLACPRCGAGIEADEGALRCDGCDAGYPIEDGIVMLARSGVSGLTMDPSGETSEHYQSWYREVDDAARYNLAYRQRVFKRWSTRRELRLIRQLLAAQGAVATLLDLPCGGGRLVPALQPHAETLIHADIARGQLEWARSHCRPTREPIWMTASAFHIPFRDEAVDAVVSCRLSHHLPSRAERERLVSELLRVARSHVVMSFFDHRSFKNLLRRLRQPLNGKPAKITMRIEEIARLAESHGARLVAAPPLSRLFSGHRYALMVKEK